MQEKPRATLASRVKELVHALAVRLSVVMDALWKFGEHERSVRVARGLFDPFCWLKKRHNQLSDGC